MESYTELSIIRPIIPDVTTIPSVDPCMVADWVLLICAVGFIAFLTASYAAGRFSGNKKKTVWFFTSLICYLFRKAFNIFISSGEFSKAFAIATMPVY